MNGLNFERVSHLLTPEALANKSVVQIGLGSGGAPVCDHLTMNGVRVWHLYDPDVFEDVNLVKHPRQRKDIGRHKVEIQRDWIVDRNAQAAVAPFAEDVMKSANFSQSVQNCSLILCCADRLDVRNYVNALAVEHRRPCITASVYRQGFGGEVYSYRPGKSGCLLCMQRAADNQGWNIDDNIELTSEEEQKIYGLSLASYRASGLSLDIQMISLLQARTALALLTEDSDRPIPASAGNWIVYYNRPIPSVHASAFNKSIYLRVQPRKDCVCHIASNGHPVAE